MTYYFVEGGSQVKAIHWSMKMKLKISKEVRGYRWSDLVLPEKVANKKQPVPEIKHSVLS